MAGTGSWRTGKIACRDLCRVDQWPRPDWNWPENCSSTKKRSRVSPVCGSGRRKPPPASLCTTPRPSQVSGSALTHRAFASHLTRVIRWQLLVVDYVRVPEHPFSTPRDDFTRFYRDLVGDARFKEKHCPGRRNLSPVSTLGPEPPDSAQSGFDFIEEKGRIADNRFASNVYFNGLFLLRYPHDKKATRGFRKCLKRCVDWPEQNFQPGAHPPRGGSSSAVSIQCTIFDTSQ